jgi:dihydroorotase
MSLITPERKFNGVSHPPLMVDALANVHSHEREGEGVMRPLVEYALDGGSDVLLPMPNTKLGLITAAMVLEYIATLKRLVPEGRVMHFIPTMLATEQTSLDEYNRAADAGIIDVKFLPLKRTTNSDYGIRRYAKMLPHVKRCGVKKIKVHCHPENPWMRFSNDDAEFAFLPFMDMFLHETKATLIWEHGTDSRCIPFWKELALSKRFFVTLTAHHLATNKDDTFGDVRAICKPPIKNEGDRLRLIDLVAEDYPWVMAGADDAPHPIETKLKSEGQCSCGAFTSPFLHQLYAHALSDLLITHEGQLTYKQFTSGNARALHKLPSASRQVKLIWQPFEIPKLYPVGPWTVMPFGAGQSINYSLAA